MKGLRSIPRILKINNIDGYLVSCLFNNGANRESLILKIFLRRYLKLKEMTLRWNCLMIIMHSVRLK